jgi:hypothetical protein
MSDISHLQQLVPTLTRRRRIALTIALVVVLVAIPTLAAAGIARPSIAVDLGIGQWDQATGLGEMELEVHNRGIVAITVESATAPGTEIALHPTRVEARSTADLRIDYVMQCDGEMFDEISADADEPTAFTMRVSGIWPVADDFTVDRVTDFLPTRGMCAP